jgi:hypothetical protein
MAASKCGSCGTGSFELVEIAPLNATHRALLVQCSACGVPVGAIDYASPAILKQRFDALQEDLQQKFRAVGQDLQMLRQKITDLSKQ